MTQKLLAQKYQPYYFDDFKENNKIIEVLKIFINLDNLNILLLGDYCYGKTTLLNAIIREYYKDFNESDYNNNILIINSLKEQGINYFRNEVKIFCQTCSIIKNKKKLLILDDIDLINSQSQQVFRNFIDKYSSNVNFITSCSIKQKVIDSLQSRLSILKLEPFNNEYLEKYINNILINENINTTKEVVKFIINLSDNNIKLILTYLEKFKLFVNNNLNNNNNKTKKITLKIADDLCCHISLFVFDEYINLVKNNKLNDALDLLYSIINKGYSVLDILDIFFNALKKTKLLNDDQKYKIIPLLCKYITIFHNIHEHEIELALFTNNLIKVLNSEYSLFI